jgi:hypothetical protein
MHFFRKHCLILLIVGVSFSFFIISSCKKDKFFDEDPSTKLTISSEEILFDTVFSTIGSTTKMFYVKNPSKNKLRITSAYLAGGQSSNYRINIDGVSSQAISNIDIEPNDSIFVFVKVTVNPQLSNTPMVVRDSVMFEVNGNRQRVMLTAWGQDAHYIVADKSLGSLKYKIVAAESQNITWANDKPYLIYGYAVIDSTAQLNIDPGCRIHFYNGSGMWVYKGGCLKVNGTKTDSVVFQGSRLESAYKNVPGQWDRIWINEGSVDNEINYAVIKNGFIGIQTETMNSSMGNQLKISNTVVANMSGMGIFSKFYKIIAGNCLVYNCGSYAICLTTGGNYDFRHCTVGNYWDLSSRTTSSLVLSNYYEDAYSGTVYSGDLTNAYFGNCIIYGSVDEEITLANRTDVGAQFNYKFENCLLKTQYTNSTAANYVSCVANADPLFADSKNFIYTLLAGSAAINLGNPNIVTTSLLNISTDLKGNDRTGTLTPDACCYQYIP